MASYKVIQDIEAEDKLVGPLSLRQFIYAVIAAVCAYLSFAALTHGLAVFLTALVPPMLLCGFFAFPWSAEQPTEVWALARIRFLVKSRKRIWNQSGAKDLVNITAPKRIEKNYTNGLSQIEVRSRLTALATTLDTRGWAIKNVNTNLFSQQFAPAVDASDRLISPSILPQEVPSIGITPADDMLDERNNPRAYQLGQMMNAAITSKRQKLMDKLNRPADSAPIGDSPELPSPADHWFIKPAIDLPPLVPTPDAAVLVKPLTDETTLPTADPMEQELAKALKERHATAPHVMTTQHLKVVQPLGDTATQQPVQPTMTPQPNPATMVLASNNDLNIATIARIANRQDGHNDEVVISLRKHD